MSLAQALLTSAHPASRPIVTAASGAAATAPTLHCHPGMTTLLALRFVDVGGILVMALLWTVLGTLFFAIVRRSRRYRDDGDPRGL